jgi:hypothetical protein
MSKNEEVLAVDVADDWLMMMATRPRSADEMQALYRADGSLLQYPLAEEAAIERLCRHSIPLPDDGRWRHPWLRAPRLRLGLRVLRAGDAEALATFKGWLCLEQLEALSAADERILATRAWPTTLDGLRELQTVELAHHIGRFGAEDMEIMNGWPGTLFIDLDAAVPRHIQLIGDEAASALASYRPAEEVSCAGNRFMREHDLTALSHRLARLLVTADADLEFLSLQELSAEAASALARARRGLSLPALEYLSVGAATGLAAYDRPDGEAWLRLDGCKNLSEDVAAILGRSAIRRLSLTGLTTISDGVAAALSLFHGEQIELGVDKSLSESALGHLRRIPPSILSLLPKGASRG